MENLLINGPRLRFRHLSHIRMLDQENYLMLFLTHLRICGLVLTFIIAHQDPQFFHILMGPSVDITPHGDPGEVCVWVGGGGHVSTEIPALLHLSLICQAQSASANDILRQTPFSHETRNIHLNKN